jgi:Mg-chelatase subunit ChlD
MAAAMVVAHSESVTLTMVAGRDVLLGTDVPVVVSVKTPDGAARTPSDIVIVLDVSGSMGQEATVMGAGGASESNGLTLLDVAKHGVRTVVKNLQAQDRFSLVLFNNEANTAVPLTVMDEAGQKIVEDKLAEFDSGGGTDIWKGLAAALQELENAPAYEPARLAHVMLLTDGESQNRDQIVPNLCQFKEQKERLQGTVSTFGFGYNIDSALLIELAHAGDGTYSFIPDAGFVGTVFVNTLSNLLVTMAREACLMLEPKEGVAEIVSVRGGYIAEKTSWGMRVPIGTLQYSQTKDIVVIVRVSGDGPYLSASADYEGIGRIAMLVDPADGCRDVRAAEVEAHCYRSCFVEMLAKIAAFVPTNGNRPAAPVQAEAPGDAIFSLPDGLASLSREDAAARVAQLAQMINPAHTRICPNCRLYSKTSKARPPRLSPGMIGGVSGAATTYLPSCLPTSHSNAITSRTLACRSMAANCSGRSRMRPMRCSISFQRRSLLRDALRTHRLRLSTWPLTTIALPVKAVCVVIPSQIHDISMIVIIHRFIHWYLLFVIAAL